jgi:hypothetical protein
MEPMPSRGASKTFTREEWKSTLSDWKESVESGKASRMNLEDLMSLTRDLVPYITAMSWVVVEAPKDRYFITCDCPVALERNPESQVPGVGWGRDDAWATLPISPQRLLVLVGGEPRGLFLVRASEGKQQLRQTNLRTMLWAEKEVYSPGEYPYADKWMRGTWPA